MNTAHNGWKKNTWSCLTVSRVLVKYGVEFPAESSSAKAQGILRASALEWCSGRARGSREWGQSVVRWCLVLKAELRLFEGGMGSHRRFLSRRKADFIHFVENLLQVGEASFWERPCQERGGQARTLAVICWEGKMQRSWGVPVSRK